MFDPAAIERETQWLIDNPEFDERPANIIEFLGEDYLGIESKIRPGVKQSLVDIFGADINPKRIAKVRYAMFTGAIGIGKTTFASIALPYMAHWVLCLKDPQDYYDLLPGSRIAFMQMSTSEKQAEEVVFGDIFARIKHSKWFVENYPYDDKFTKQIRFAKDIWILPGDSAETTFEGYNILGGILDEADSHKQTKDKDYADVGFDTINSRIDSRFQDRGLLIVVGQMKKATGFAKRKYEEFLNDPNAHVTRMTIWESLGWEKFLNLDGSRDSFFYDTKRKQIVPTGVAAVVATENIIEIPTVYKKNFQNNPEKALRDLGGVPPNTSDPFISLEYKVTLARDKWVDRYGYDSPVDENPTRPKLADWFKAENDPRRRAAHIDLAYSGDGDACGIAMGHVEQVVEIDEEKKPYIIIDLLYRVRAMPGTEIMISDIRRIIYELRDERRFRLKKITMDGFQSTDTMQQLRKRRFEVDYLSIDRNTLPYEDLREAIYEERIEFPKYMTYINKGDTKLVEITVQELLNLQETPKKVDHPVGGSKDLADAMAGVVSTLMGDRAYRKGVTSITEFKERKEREQKATGTAGMPGMGAIGPFGGTGLRAPVPPSGDSTGLLGLSIPPRLQPRRER